MCSPMFARFILVVIAVLPCIGWSAQQSTTKYTQQYPHAGRVSVAYLESQPWYMDLSSQPPERLLVWTGAVKRHFDFERFFLSANTRKELIVGDNLELQLGCTPCLSGLSCFVWNGAVVNAISGFDSFSL